MPELDIKGGLTRKLGPLPVWGWGGVVIGGIVVYKIAGGGSGASSGGAPLPGFTGGGGGANGGGGGGGFTGGSDGASGGVIDDNPADPTPISEPWYAVIPGVGTIIDRAADAVTIIRDPPALTPTPTPTVPVVPTPSLPTVPTPTIPTRALPVVRVTPLPTVPSIIAAIQRIAAPTGTRYVSAWRAPDGSYVKTRTASGVVNITRPPTGTSYASIWLSPDGSYVKTNTGTSTATGDTGGYRVLGLPFDRAFAIDSQRASDTTSWGFDPPDVPSHVRPMPGTYAAPTLPRTLTPARVSATPADARAAIMTRWRAKRTMPDRLTVALQRVGFRPPPSG